MTRPFAGALLLSLAACAIPNHIDRLQDRCPPPEYGRPGWVRTLAGVGAWIGGIGGGAVSIVLLPVTYPISLLAQDELGETSQDEFLLFPAMCGAAIGHALLGGPPDCADYVFRRAWVGTEDPVNTYEYVPMPDPALPQPLPQQPPAEQAPAAAATGR